ncbi:MAG: ABC transporter ATP-binding protein, partial [Armatimonadetes bacterium]|nr:ABC transporter ATP-binding protein [Armatimonadota bacterium]
MTVLLSSHLLPEVQILCTHVGLMFGGRLVASGPVSQLLRDQPAKVSFQVDDPVRARQIAQALGATAAVSDDGSLDATLEPDAVAELNAALVRGGIRVYAIVPQRRSLEDLYMEYASSANNGKGNNR